MLAADNKRTSAEPSAPSPANAAPATATPSADSPPALRTGIPPDPPTGGTRKERLSATPLALSPTFSWTIICFERRNDEDLGYLGGQMRIVLLIVWLASLAALLALLGHIYLHGNTIHRTSLAEDLGILWAGSFLAWGILTWKAKQQ